MLTVNLRAVFFVLQAVARTMKARSPLAGVISLTRSAAQALAPDRITSNCVCPGAVGTAMWEQLDEELAALHHLAPKEAWPAWWPSSRGRTPTT